MSKESTFRPLDCILTAEEIDDRRAIAAAKVAERGRIMAEKKEVADGFSKRLKAVEAEMDRAAGAADSGSEVRLVRCVWMERGLLRVLVREDTGAEVDREALSTDEVRERRQTKLPLEDGPSHASDQGDEAQAEDDDEDEPASNDVEKQEEADEASADAPQLQPALADRLLGTIRHLSDTQLSGGGTEYVRLSELRRLFPDETLITLREAGEELLERGAIDGLPGNPGVWRPTCDRNRQIVQEQDDEDAAEESEAEKAALERHLDELLVCEVLDGLRGEGTAQDIAAIASTEAPDEELTDGDVEVILSELVERGCVRVVSEGPRKGKTFGLLPVPTRVLAQLRAAGDRGLSERHLVRAAVLEQADVEELGALVLKGLIVETIRGYTLAPAVEAQKPTKKGRSKKASAA